MSHRSIIFFKPIAGVSKIIVYLEQLRLAQALRMQFQERSGHGDQLVELVEFGHILRDSHIHLEIQYRRLVASQNYLVLFVVIARIPHQSPFVVVVLLNVLHGLVILVKHRIELNHLLLVLTQLIGELVLLAVGIIFFEVDLGLLVIFQETEADSFIVVAFAEHFFEFKFPVMNTIEALGSVNQAQYLFKTRLLFEILCLDHIYIHNI